MFQKALHKAMYTCTSYSNSGLKYSLPQNKILVQGGYQFPLHTDSCKFCDNCHAKQSSGYRNHN